MNGGCIVYCRVEQADVPARIRCILRALATESAITVTGVNYQPDDAVPLPFGGPFVRPLDEGTAVLRDMVDVAKQQLKHLKKDEDWKGASDND